MTVLWDSVMRLISDGGLANAGNIALSLLLSLFPFMILLASFADLWGDPKLLEEILILLFDHWPAGSAGPIADQIKIVLTQARGELFTIGNVIALILATNGIESARDGLNRAYQFEESRNFFVRRLQGSAFVTIGAIALILAALILVATPVAWQFLITRFDWLLQFSFMAGAIQYGLAIILLGLALFAFHYFLPDGSFKGSSLFWGISVTIIGILIGSKLFAIYLTNFADYVTIYAGLSGVMIAIVYLYGISTLILLGAEVNAAISRHRDDAAKLSVQ